MAVNQIDVSALKTKLNNAFNEKQKGYEKLLEERRAALLNPEDNADMEDKVDRFENAIRKVLTYNNTTGQDVWGNRITAANIFNKMAYNLTQEFGENVVVDVEHFTIRFPWSGHTINFPVKMLASMYNLHSGMFGFDSSFTTHEAYTVDNYKICIGIWDADDSVVEIRFGKIDELN